jgi:hypothetical protein
MTSVLQLLRLLQDFHIIPVLLNRQAVANVFKACKVVSRNVVTNDEVSGAQFTCFTCFPCIKAVLLSQPQRSHKRRGVRCSVFPALLAVLVQTRGFVRFIERVAAAYTLSFIHSLLHTLSPSYTLSFIHSLLRTLSPSYNLSFVPPDLGYEIELQY